MVHRHVVRLTLVLVAVVLGPATAQPRVEPSPDPGRAPFAVGTFFTVLPITAGLLMANADGDIEGAEVGVLIAGAGLVFGPTTGHLAMRNWRGAALGTGIRVGLAATAVWLADDADWGADADAVVVGAMTGLVALLDLVQLARGRTAEAAPLRAGIDPRTGAMTLSARRSF